MIGSVAGTSVQGNKTSITNMLCFTVVSPGRADSTLSGIIFFFLSPVGIISSRICSFILPDSRQGGSTCGGLF